MLGAERWMFNVTDAVAMFPVWSKASPVITWFAPDVVTTIGGGHVPIPERESEQVKDFLTYAVSWWLCVISCTSRLHMRNDGHCDMGDSVRLKSWLTFLFN
jgi:hypothetical protein